ncbi:MAG: hypothetical protein VX335_01210 [Pseudomonadota bacterium]|nr:hypothetical protein [Pseudomonadota bacterium]
MLQKYTKKFLRLPLIYKIVISLVLSLFVFFTLFFLLQGSLGITMLGDVISPNSVKLGNIVFFGTNALLIASIVTSVVIILSSLSLIIFSGLKQQKNCDTSTFETYSPLDEITVEFTNKNSSEENTLRLSNIIFTDSSGTEFSPIKRVRSQSPYDEVEDISVDSKEFRT